MSISFILKSHIEVSSNPDLTLFQKLFIQETMFKICLLCLFALQRKRSNFISFITKSFIFHLNWMFLDHVAEIYKNNNLNFETFTWILTEVTLITNTILIRNTNEIHSQSYRERIQINYF
jgi:hypothetical protein